MKTVIGVDLAGMYEPSLRLCLDLGFPNQELFFLHAIEPVPEFAPPMHEEAFSALSWMTHLRDAGRQALQKAEALSKAAGVPSHGATADGSACANLMTFAEQEAADLIVIGSARQNRVSGFLFGSVAKGLAIGAKQSILATKAEESVPTPIKAVFATDHSEYANRCLKKLIQWAPKGIASIDVGTAYEFNTAVADMLEGSLPDTNENLEQMIEARLQKRSEGDAAALTEAGYRSQAFVRKGHPNNVLPALMAETGANLMIVGAQGHGFLDRLLIGSVSLHQITNEPYPVLLLRD